MDPFLGQVLDRLQRETGEQFGIQQSRLGDQAASSGAFGGSRHAVRESEMASNLQEQLADQQAQLLSRGYQQALGQYGQDLGRAMGGQQQLAGLAGAGQEGVLTGAQAQAAAGADTRCIQRQDRAR